MLRKTLLYFQNLPSKLATIGEKAAQKQQKQELQTLRSY